MGYKSDVRIRLTVKDYEKMKKQFEREIVDIVDYNLFDKNHLDVYKELEDVPCWKVTDDGEDVEETHDCVFFGWNSVRWYDNYADVKFIMEFLDECDHYAFCRIGESCEGDVETHERNMDMIGFYYAFEEEE